MLLIKPTQTFNGKPCGALRAAEMEGNPHGILDLATGGDIDSVPVFLSLLGSVEVGAGFHVTRGPFLWVVTPHIAMGHVGKESPTALVLEERARFYSAALYSDL